METKIIVTLGPATNKKQDIEMIKHKGADFVRINMSHSTTDDLKYFISLAKKVGIPFIIDTEGSQIRTGELESDRVYFKEGQTVKIFKDAISGTNEKICLKPAHIIKQLEPGDIIHVDFDSLILKVSDTSTIENGYIYSTVIAGGTLGRNKAVTVDPVVEKYFDLPPLSEKDYQSIIIGLEENIGHIAASFMRNKEFVREVKKASKGKMKVISKIECVDALDNLDEIIESSDYILIDRGDLSKEIPIESIPYAQKMIMNRAKKLDTGVFVATNLLETMIENKRPTRAEVHDTISTIINGAEGVTLSAETAIGKYPFRCVSMMKKLIHQADLAKDVYNGHDAESDLVDSLFESDYINKHNSELDLISFHGGGKNLFERKAKTDILTDSFPSIKLTPLQQINVQNIGVGAYSPLSGFMNKDDANSVINSNRLSNNTLWPVPILLDVTKSSAKDIKLKKDIVLKDDSGPMAIMHVSEIYELNELENINDLATGWSKSLNPVLIAGDIELIGRRKSRYSGYEITPKQARRLFSERGWTDIAGIHSDDVPSRLSESFHINTLYNNKCDGLFIQPVWMFDSHTEQEFDTIIKSYEKITTLYYPQEKIFLATFPIFNTGSSERDMIFNAIIKKNYGCNYYLSEQLSSINSEIIDDTESELGIVFSMPDNLKEIQSDQESSRNITNDVKNMIHSIAAGESSPESRVRPEVVEIVKTQGK